MATTPIDEQIGRRIRQRRETLGLTQADIGRAVGVRHQQIFRFEQGMNRISAVQLWRIADALDMPIEAFFAGLNAKARCESRAGR